MRIPLTKTMLDVQWAFISIVTSSLAHFILRIVLGRELGAEALGIYTLAFTIYLFGMQFAAFGIGSALTKYVAEFIEDPDSIRIYVSSGMTSSIITGTLMGIALFFLSPFIATSFFKIPDLQGLIQLLALTYPFIAIQKAVLGTLNGYRRMPLFAFLNISLNVLIVILSLVLVLEFHMGVLGGVIGLVVPAILIGVLCPFLIKEQISLDTSLWNTAALRATTAFGIYVVLANIIGIMNAEINSIFIGFFLNPTEVGIFAVAALLAQTLTLIPSAVQRVTAPITATLYGKRDFAGIRKMIISTIKMISLISIIIGGTIFVYGEQLIVILFKEEFLTAYNPLIILLFGQMIFAPYIAIGATLSSIDKVQIPFRISTACLIINIVLNIILIPFFGIIGASVATTCSMILSCSINSIVIRRYLWR